jgi:hypothetical protein
MGPISDLATHENLRNKLNTTKKIQFINRYIRFDKVIKCVIRLFVEYRYFCVNSQLRDVNIHTSTKIQARTESIHHLDYIEKYSLK